MINFAARIRVESKGFEGVAYTLRRMSPARRSAFWAANAEYRARIREIARERRPLDDEYRKAYEKAGAARAAEVARLVAAGVAEEQAKEEAAFRLEMDPERLRRFFELRADEQAVDQNLLRPNLVRAMLDTIEGYTIDGQAATAETLIAEGSERLFDEIAEACSEVMELPADARGNWQWPATSAGAEGGPTTSTTASSAGTSGGGITPAGGVPDTSPRT